MKFKPKRTERLSPEEREIVDRFERGVIDAAEAGQLLIASVHSVRQEAAASVDERAWDREDRRCSRRGGPRRQRRGLSSSASRNKCTTTRPDSERCLVARAICLTAQATALREKRPALGGAGFRFVVAERWPRRHTMRSHYRPLHNLGRR